jgi:HlyD family secretion protein
MKKSILIRLIVLILLLSGGTAAYFFWWLPRQQQAASAAQTPVPVTYQTVQVRKGQQSHTVASTGAVRSKQTALLAWQTSGTVSQVNGVFEQVVQAKAVLAALERTSLPQSVIMAQADLVTAQKNLDTLLQSSQARANAELALVKAQKALDDAKDDRRSLLYQRASPETIDLTRARLIAANDALDKAEDFFDGHSSDPKSLTYATALSQLAKARQDQIRAQYNLNYAADLPDPLDIEEADAKIKVADANVLQAKLDWERVKDGPNQDDVAAAEARVAAAQATINLARITAPFTGTLNLVNAKVGDQITPGVVAFQLDDLSHLYLDVAVSEDDIQRVQVGQAVQLTLDSLPGKEYAGTVTEIGAVGKTTAGTVNFTVTVEISQPGSEIKPGMTASVTITAGQARTALLISTRALRTQDGQRVVYLLKDGTPIPVAVLTGASQNGETVIEAGEVKEGDLIVVNP